LLQGVAGRAIFFVMQLVIETQEEADRLRLVLERGLQALGSPDVATDACKRQKALKKRLAERDEKQGEQTQPAA
jgi:hypothetical protein